MRNVSKEFELYQPMKYWLNQYLINKYHTHKVKTIDSHAVALDTVLEENGILDQYPQTVGLNIQIDVLGIVDIKRRSKIIFIEAKKTDLTLRDLGQLWGYCKLCDPAEAFLFSSKGIGSLNKILRSLKREDLLDFGTGKTIKKMRVAKWDIDRDAPDFMTMIPKMD